MSRASTGEERTLSELDPGSAAVEAISRKDDLADDEGEKREAAPADSPASQAKVEPPPFEEGGLQGWSSVASAFLLLFVTFGSCNGFGVYQSWYELHQFSNESSSNISWIGSIQLFLVFAGGPFSGHMFDRGYCRQVLLVGGALQIIGVFMTSLCKKYWQAILAQAFLTGIGCGLQFLPAVSVISHHFRRRRAMAMGIATVGSSFGGLVFPIMLNRLFIKIGFKKGVQASGYLILACIIVANLLVRPKPPPKPLVKQAPPSLKVIFSNLKYDLLCAGGFFVALGLFFPIFYLQIYAQNNGVSESLAFYLISILNAASVFGRVLPNFFADKFGAFNMLIPCVIVSGILCFSLFGAKNPGGAIAFAIIYGFSSGAYVSVIGPAIISLSSSMAEVGIRLGLAFCIVGLAALVGTPIAGALLTATKGAFYAPIIFAGLCIFIGTGFLITSRHLQARDKGTQKV